MKRIDNENRSHVGMFNCYYCNKPMGVLIDKRGRKTLTRNCGVINDEPCNECKKWMKEGIIFISIKDSTTEDEMKPKNGMPPNPFRTGKWAVIKDEAVKQLINGTMLDFALKYRFIFITDGAWEAIGIPVGNSETKEGEAIND